MLIDPESGLPYIPTPSYFLGCFDIYDREETLGVELERFDPNDPIDRELLILKYCLPRKRSYRQRYLLYKCLELSLEDPNYDFQALLENDPEEFSSFPYGWDKMDCPRSLFEDIYRLATLEWRNDIEKASAEDEATWS